MHIVIIGNGIAANTAASTIRRLNNHAKITMISAETSPLYSACILADYLAGDIQREALFLKKFEDYARENTDVFWGRATEIDIANNKVYLENGVIDYDRLIIATGSRTVLPLINGLNKEGVYTFKTLSDADRLCGHIGKKAVVVGSGPVGIEVSIALKKRGYAVFLIESLDWVLPRVFDRYPASLLADTLAEQGIEILTGERVFTINGDRKVCGLLTNRRQLDCDTVVFAVGMKPNVELARKAGLKLGNLGGILVDDQMRTSADGVYACGDCIETKDVITGENTLCLLWHNAMQEGEVAGMNCIGNQRTYPGRLSITKVNIYDVHAVSVGSTLASLADSRNIEIIEKGCGAEYYRLVISDDTLVGFQAIGRPAQYTGILLGAMRRRDSVRRLKAEAQFISWDSRFIRLISRYLSP